MKIEKSKSKKGSHGGLRSGSGRKPSAPLLVCDAALRTSDPGEFLKAIMANPEIDLKLRFSSAKKLIDWQRKTRNANRDRKRADQAEAAVAAVTGRFAPQGPPGNAPKLRLVK